MRPILRPFAVLCALFLAAPLGVAQDNPEPDTDSPVIVAPDTTETTEVSPRPVRDPNVGPVTGLPIPRFVSLKANEANVRRGPSTSYRIDWIFTRRDMPLRVTAEHENWRRVVDRDGMGGWVHYIMLSGVRTVIVDADLQPLYARPDEQSPQEAQLEAGVVARIEECAIDWCRVSAGGYKGWAPKTAFWGVGADEILD